jgi:hypothetical protein
MDLIDLLRSLPGLLLLGLLPGVALVSLIRPSMPGWWRLAMAPGVSCGVVGVIGLLYHDAHITFELRTVLPPIALLAAAALLRARIRPAQTADPDITLRSRPGRLVLAGGLAAGLISAGLLTSALRVGPLPIAGDSPIHGFVTQAIALQDDVMVAQPLPVAQSGAVRARPAFEAAAALVAGVTDMRPVSAMVPLTLLAVLLLPVSLGVLMYEATRSWRMAAVVPLLGVGMTLITFAARFGEYPYLVDLTLVVPMIVSARRALMGVAAGRELALIVVLVGAVWALHGLEVLTALVIGVPFAVASIRDLPWRDVAERAILVAFAVALAAGVVTVLTRVPAQPIGLLPPNVTAADQAANFLGVWGPPHSALHAYADFLGTEMAGAVATIPYLLGLIAAVRVKGMRWALVAHVVLLVILADVAYSVVLRRLWTPLFPWSVIDRIVSIQWFVVPLLSTWGLFNMRKALDIRPSQRRRPATVVLVGMFVGGAVLTPIVGGAHELSRIRDAAASEDPSTDADMAALTAMDRMLPPGTVVLTQGRFDAGQWTDAVTRDLEWAPLAYSRGVLEGGSIILLDDRGRALGAACSDPVRARQALDGLGAVYVGSKLEPGSPAPWKASCIARLPGVTEVVHATSGGRTAHVFIVEPVS